MNQAPSQSKRRLTARRILAFVAALLAVLSLYEGWRLWRGLGGAGLFPSIIAVVLLGLSLTFLLVGQDGDEQSLPKWSEFKGALIVASAFALYVVVADKLGYIIVTILVLAIVARATSDASMRVAVIWPTFLAIGSFALFRWMGVHLPTGILGF